MSKKKNKTAKSKAVVRKRPKKGMTNKVRRELAKIKKPKVVEKKKVAKKKVAKKKKVVKRLSAKRREKLKNIRKNLYNVKYRLRLKLSKETRITYRRKLNRQILAIVVETNEVNNQLGCISKCKLPTKADLRIKRVKDEDNHVVQVKTLPIWEARDLIDEIIKKKKIKTFVIDGAEYKRQNVDEVHSAFSELEDSAYNYGVNTPMVDFQTNPAMSMVVISIFGYK